MSNPAIIMVGEVVSLHPSLLKSTQQQPAKHNILSILPELILRIAGNGDIVGHRGLGDDSIYPVSGTTLAATNVCFVDLQCFNDILKANTEFLYKLLMFFAAELKESENRMRNLAHMTVKGRVSNAILFLHQNSGAVRRGISLLH